MLTLSMSMPRPKRLVATRMRFWKSLNCWYLQQGSGEARKVWKQASKINQ